MPVQSSGLRLCFAAITLHLLAAFASAQGDPAQVGKWGATIPTTLVSIHTILLPNGKVMYWDRHDLGTHDMTPRIWDSKSGLFTKAPKPEFDLFCSGHSYLRNGDLLIAGGHISDEVGVDRIAIYHPKTNTFDFQLPRMNQGRWYPTNTTLPNGDVLITSGTFDEKLANAIPQVYDWRTRTLRTLDSAKLVQGYYPFTYPAGTNRVFVAGPDPLSRYLDVRGSGRWINAAMTKSRIYRDYGTSVMYEPGKVLIAGGGVTPPTSSAEIINLRSSSPSGWAFTDSMQYARRHATAVMLPDGNVAVFGGTSGPGVNNAKGAVFHPEMWNPATGKWTLWAPNKTLRIYHSIAMLLPDGRVLTGGGGHPGDSINYLDAHPDWEIFEPPYLFKGPRPAIDSAPDTLRYGKPFMVSTRASGDLKASLLRISAVTHAFDQNQNFNRLALKRLSGTSVQVTPPPDSLDTSPGPHLLFLLDAAGVPSVGKMVMVEYNNEPATGLARPRTGQGMAGAAFRVGLKAVRLDGRRVKEIRR